MSRPDLLIVTGLQNHQTAAVVDRMRALDPDAAVLHHDLRDIGPGHGPGVVHRRLRRGAEDVATTLELAHGCVSCTLREDLLPSVRALAGAGGPRRIVLHLDPALEPEQVCRALAEVPVDGAPVLDDVDLLGVVTCVDAGSWLDDATGTAVLADHGIAELPDDERTVAQVAVGQVEFADLIVHTGTAEAWRLARTDSVLIRLAPMAPRVHLADLDARVFLSHPFPGARRGRPDDVHGPLLRGQPPLQPDCGVRTLLFGARRPFHPERLHRAIDVLLVGVVRTRGRIWLATRPGAVLWLESAGGGLQVGYAGDWLAGSDAATWDGVCADRRAMAALAWDPRFGDRAQDLVVITHDADPEEIDARLRAALLTDDELVAGEDAWRSLPDPFGWWHTEPCAAADPSIRRAGTQDEEPHR